MTTYFAKLTAAGAAAFVASESGAPVVLAQLAVGDAGGVPYDPTGAETALVNETARVSIESVGIDPDHADYLRITAIIPADTGGFTIREVGVFTDAGDLAVIANFPPTEKPAIADGAPSDLTLGLVVQFTGDPTVTVEVDPSEVYATREWVWGEADFVAVASATTTAPPGAPAIGDKYLVPHAGASGAWAAQADKLAVWAGAPADWLFFDMAVGAMVSAADSPVRYVRSAAGWAALDATNADSFAVKSATTVGPPGAPALGDKYLIPHAGTGGAWVGHEDQVAVWVGAPVNWLYVVAPEGAIVSVADTPQRLRRTAAGWVELTHGMTAQATVTGAEELGGFDPATGAEVKITTDQVAGRALSRGAATGFFLGMM